MTQHQTETVSRRTALVGLSAGAIGLALATRSLRASAQDASPTSSANLPGLPPGVSGQAIAMVDGRALPTPPGDIEIDRFRLEPGAFFPLGPNNPSLTIVIVEAGAPTSTLSAPVAVANVETGVSAESTPEVGYPLQPGDAATLQPNTEGWFQNDGAEPAILLAVTISPAG
jgi:hypothetical protein